MKKISIFCFALLSFLFSQTTQSQTIYLKGILQGSQDTVTSNGSGVVIVRYDKGTKTLKLYGDYAGLTSAVADAHIHRGQPGFAGPVVIQLTFSVPSDTTGSLTGTGTLTQVQEDSLLAGNMYVNVHSANHPNGELRAQLTAATAASIFLSARLQSAQETPPNPSLGKGSAYALVSVAADPTKDSIFMTGNYTGLTGASTMAHIHTAPPDSAGPVLLPVHHSFAAAGVVHVADAVNPNAAAVIVAGGSYVNVHTVLHGGGEIRGQLINNATAKYFTGELSGSNEAQPTTSKGRGVVIASYNPDLKTLQIAGDYQNLSDSIMRAYVVLPGATPDTIQLVTTKDSTGTLTNFGATIPDAAASALTTGTAFVNVITGAFPNGEVRANLTATVGETQVFAVKLTPGQEFAPNNTGSATGNALVLLEKATGKTYVTGAFQGFNSASTRAYIHGGAVGDSSGSFYLDVIHDYVPGKKSGTFSGVGTVPTQAIDSMVNGLAFINIWSVGRPVGAIRGQLGNLVLPLKLKYFNGYKQRNEVELVWETAEELNVDHYEIEQSNARTNSWDTKGTVSSKGSSTGSSYSFNDVPNTNGNKYLIYRLKMVDKDGRFTYSPLVKINFDQVKAELFIQTNPIVNGELKYTITGLSAGKTAEVSVIDFNGRVILRNTTSTLINNTLRMPKLASGMYKLMVRVDGTFMQKSFIK